MNLTRLPAWHAQTANAVARCVLPRAAVADQDHRIAVIDPGALGQRGDRGLRDLRVVSEAKVLQARLHRADQGFWQYRCDGSEQSHGLAEIRAYLAYGAVRRITPVEAARWHERLDHEAGLRDLVPVPLLLPEGASHAATRVAGGISLLLGLRDARWASGEPFVFARGFAIAYCGVTDDVARRGVEELEALGVIERAGKIRFAIRWRLRCDTGQGVAP